MNLAEAIYPVPSGLGRGRAEQKHRFHLHQGPIDLIIDLVGSHEAVVQARSNAEFRFSSILKELVGELSRLRQATEKSNRFSGSTAARMWCATSIFENEFITPMAAVAGAVADEILASLCATPGLHRVMVNNGGDIALWGLPDEVFTVGVVSQPCANSPQMISGTVVIEAAAGINGVATSGWRGRSQSLGIADSVTVFADNAATADAAATMIANQVDVVSPHVVRKPAQELYPDSDLEARLITLDVLQLNQSEITVAVDAGKRYAENLQSRGLIKGAVIALSNRYEVVGRVNAKLQPADIPPVCAT